MLLCRMSINLSRRKSGNRGNPNVCMHVLLVGWGMDICILINWCIDENKVKDLRRLTPFSSIKPGWIQELMDWLIDGECVTCFLKINQ